MKTLVLVCAILLCMVSCRKNPDNSKVDLLTEKPWKFVKIESKVNNGPWMDEVQFWPQCQKDDEIVFMRDHSYAIRNGAMKCNPTDPDEFDVATWNFVDKETKLDMDGAVTTIEVLNHTQLVLSSTETTGGDAYLYRYTLEH